MWNKAFGVLLFVSSILLFYQDAFCCGDKFLVVGRGIRFQKAKNPGSILVYRNRSYEDPKAGDALLAALKKAGHSVQSVDDITKLDSTLKSGKYDLVLANLQDVALLQPEISAAPSKPAVLPVVYNKPGAELAAGKQYDCVLTAAKNANVLAVVDKAMGSKLKGEPIKCDWKKTK